MQRVRLALPIVALLAVASPDAAARDRALDLIRALRADGCPQSSSSSIALGANSALDAVAREVIDGRTLEAALQRARVQVTRSAAITLRDSRDESSLIRQLESGYCRSITDPAFTAAGIARRGDVLAIVLADPHPLPSARSAGTIRREVLTRVNEARATPRQCGDRRFGAVPPLTLNAKLNDAAAAQARDMAERGVISHRGADGSEPGDRITRAGYAWAAVGENVASGQATAREVVAQWLDSPEHCANIMSRDFTQMGVAYTTRADRRAGIFWSQVFARPR